MYVIVNDFYRKCKERKKKRPAFRERTVISQAEPSVFYFSLAAIFSTMTRPSSSFVMIGNCSMVWSL